MAATNYGMRAFRAAATLADVVPTARIGIRDGQRQICVVSQGRPETGDGENWLPPRAFRAAVGRAYRTHLQGIRLRFVGMAPEDEPAIDVGLRTGDVVLPGQIYRVRSGDERFLFLFMTELDVAHSERVVTDAMATSKRCDERDDRTGPTVTARRVGFHADGLTELTVVHTMSTIEDAEAAGRIMARLLEVCVAAEAIAEVESVAPSPRRGMAP